MTATVVDQNMVLPITMALKAVNNIYLGVVCYYLKIKWKLMH